MVKINDLLRNSSSDLSTKMSSSLNVTDTTTSSSAAAAVRVVSVTCRVLDDVSPILASVMFTVMISKSESSADTDDDDAGTIVLTS